MSEILKSIKARLNRLKKIEEEHKRNTDDIIRQKQENTQEKCSTQCNEPDNPDKERFFLFFHIFEQHKFIKYFMKTKLRYPILESSHLLKIISILPPKYQRKLATRKITKMNFLILFVKACLSQKLNQKNSSQMVICLHKYNLRSKRK